MELRPRPVLTGRSVRLRPLVASDADAMFAALEDAETMRLTGTRGAFTLNQVRAWCAGLEAAEDRIDLAIVSRGDGGYLGEVVLNEIEPLDRRASFRIALAAIRHAGRGYGSEAARLLLGYAFDVLRLHRVELEVYAFNPRAIHVYEKLGFRREGVRRDALWQDGAFHDAIQMGMLEGELVREA